MNITTKQLSKKRKTINTIAGTFICVVILFTLNMTDFGLKCKTIENDVLRLHIIANSDSDEDQNLKLKVRDKLLSEGEEIFNGSVTKDNAVEKLSDRLSLLEQSAQQVINESGLDYSATVSIKKEYFSTRYYNDFTLPAGNYLSLTVNLGKAEGHNWWCVMFPPLCLPAAKDNCEEIYNGALSDAQRNIIENNNKYKIGFKVIEWYNEIKNAICD